MTKPNISKIAWIHDKPHRYGGAESYIYEVTSHFNSLGVQSVLLYSPDFTPDQSFLRPFQAAFPIIDLESQLDEIQSDVIYVNNYKDSSILNVIKKRTEVTLRFLHDHYFLCPRTSKIKAITKKTCHSSVSANCLICPGFVLRENKKIKIRWPWEVKKQIKMHQNFDRIIVSSQYLERHLLKNNFPTENVWIGPLYPDSGVGKADNDKVQKNLNQLLYVGSLIKGKGVDHLIKSLSRVDYQYKLIIAGEGPEKEKLQKLAKMLNGQTTILFKGRLNKKELSLEYLKSRAIIVPSTLPETFSKAGIDGLSNNCIPLCSNVGGISQWLKEGKNGVLFPSGNELELSRVLTNLKDNKYSSIEKYIQNNHQKKYLTIDDHTDGILSLIKQEKQKLSKNQKYSYSENDQFVHDIDKICAEFKQITISVIDPKYLSCILLIGGYGRGEGGVYENGSKLVPHNNLDFNIITQGALLPFNILKYRNKILRLLKKITEGTEISIDFSIIQKWKIKFGPNKLIYYDMKFGHRLVYGTDQWLLNIKSLTHKKIALHDIRDLILNRGTLLILNEEILKRGRLSLKDKKVIIRHLVKAIIGYGDALLYLHHKYHWSYQRKREHMQSIAACYPYFSKLYLHAIDFRFNPDYSKLLSKDLSLLSKFTLRSVERIHLHFEKSVSQDFNLKWEDYFSSMLNNPYYSHRFNLINILIHLRNILKFHNNYILKYKIFRQRIVSKMLGERGELLAIYPFVIYKKKIPTEFLKNVRGIENKFIKNWGGFGDDNFKQSAPAKILGAKKK